MASQKFPHVHESGGGLIVVFQEQPNVEARLYEPDAKYFREAKQGRIAYSLAALSAAEARKFAAAIDEAAELVRSWESGNISREVVLVAYGTETGGEG